MHDEKNFFCNSELSLPIWLRGWTVPNHLSQSNKWARARQNFYGYINTLRIEEFKRLATSRTVAKYTLMALAEASGFNSKSSFNRYFKDFGAIAFEYLQSVSPPQKVPAFHGGHFQPVFRTSQTTRLPVKLTMFKNGSHEKLNYYFLTGLIMAQRVRIHGRHNITTVAIWM